MNIVIQECYTSRVMAQVASYPGLPMFFNVSHEKSGKPGRLSDVMRHVDTIWDAV